MHSLETIFNAHESLPQCRKPLWITTPIGSIEYASGTIELDIMREAKA